MFLRNQETERWFTFFLLAYLVQTIELQLKAVGFSDEFVPCTHRHTTCKKSGGK